MKRTKINEMVTESKEYIALDSYVKAIEDMIAYVTSNEEDQNNKEAALVHLKASQRYFDNERRKLCGGCYQ
jgi:hypothetical protein